jgi:hypothetical protein
VRPGRIEPTSGDEPQELRRRERVEAYASPASPPTCRRAPERALQARSRRSHGITHLDEAKRVELADCAGLVSSDEIGPKSGQELRELGARPEVLPVPRDRTAIVDPERTGVARSPGVRTSTTGEG